jgi:hypothetical protein
MNFCQIVNPSYEPAWFHEKIASVLERALENTLTKKKTRIILSIPPRHGKSQLASIYFPAWALGKYPTLKFILSTYGAELSEEIGMKTRDTISSELYQGIFPNAGLKADTKSKAKWMTDKGGSYTAVGVGGAITGKGGDCVIGSTLIQTNKGKKRIDEVVTSHQSYKVLSYNYDNKKLEWKRILASVERPVSNIIEIRTSTGRIIRCTADHRIYTKNRGYVKAIELSPSDTLLRFTGMRQVQKSNSTKCERGKTINSSWNKICGMFSWLSSQKTKNSKRFSMSLLWGKCKTYKPHNKILHNELQEQVSLRKNAWYRKFKLQTRKCFRCLPERILQTTKTNLSEGRKQMRDMFFSSTFNLSPYRSQSQKQYSGEFNNVMPELPLDSSRIESDTVSSVKRTGDKEVVYDIQVEDNHNFFAEDILISNCIIIDDPHKDRAEAESELARKTVFDYYRSTLYSRLEGMGTIIVIMQRWRQDDLVGLLLEEDERIKKENPESAENWEVIDFPAIAIDDEYDSTGVLVRKEGEVLWKDKYPMEFLQLIRQQSPYFWASQYMQNPILAEAAEFKKEYFRYFNEEELKGKYLRYYTICDPAISQKKSGDNTVVVTIAKEVSGPNFYRIREDAGKYTPQQTVDLIFTHQSEYKSDVAVETVQYQQALKFMIVEEQRKRSQFFVMHELKSSTKKEERIRGMLALYQNGLMHHRYGDLAYEEELLAFPNGRRDDRVDAAAYILQIASNTYTSNSVRQFKQKWLGYGKKSH